MAGFQLSINGRFWVSTEAVAADVRKLEEELGIKPGFMNAIFDEDDWSFVIKMHAVMEAAVAHLLTVVVGEPRLKPFFSRLELSGSTLGKVAVVKLLELLDERDRRFIKSLSGPDPNRWTG